MSLPPAEFGRLALEQIDTLARVAASLTGSKMEADDLVQETYLRALRGRAQFRPREWGLRPWLLRIMHNVHVTRSARARKQPVATDPAKLENRDTQRTAFPALPPELDDTVRGAVAELPPDLRTALTLWAVEELSYKEMADVLDVPIGTVMSRLYRARQVLAGKLRERAPEMLPGTVARYG